MERPHFPKRCEVAGRVTNLVKGIHTHKTAGEMKRQGQISQLSGDRVQIWIAFIQVFPILLQQVDAGFAVQCIYADGLLTVMGRPRFSPAGDKHPTPAALRKPSMEQILVIAVVEDQKPWQVTFPRAADEAKPFILRSFGKLRCSVGTKKAQGAIRDLTGHIVRILHVQPEHTAVKEPAVAMRELGGELRFADTALSREGGAILHQPSLSLLLDGLGEVEQLPLAAHDGWVAVPGHPRCRWKTLFFA